MKSTFVATTILLVISLAACGDDASDGTGGGGTGATGGSSGGRGGDGGVGGQGGAGNAAGEGGGGQGGGGQGGGGQGGGGQGGGMLGFGCTTDNCDTSMDGMSCVCDGDCALCNDVRCFNWDVSFSCQNGIAAVTCTCEVDGEIAGSCDEDGVECALETSCCTQFLVP